MKMGSAHAKPLLPMGCKADTLGTALSGLIKLRIQRNCRGRRAPALARKNTSSKDVESKSPSSAVLSGGALYPSKPAEGW